MNTNKRLVILLVGNTIEIPIDASEIPRLDELLQTHVIKATQRHWVSINETQVDGGAVIGWYFKEDKPNENLEILRRMEKKIPDANEGENWRDDKS